MTSHTEPGTLSGTTYPEISGNIRKKLIRFFLTLLLYLLLLAVSIPFRLYAQSSGAGYSEAYLLRDVGARPLSMAGAYSAIVNEPNAIFYNPSGLAFFGPEPLVSTSYSFLEFGRKHAVLSYGQSIYDNLGIGFGLNSFSSGSFMGRDIKGNPLGTLTDWSYSFVGALGYRIEFASLGASFKYLSNNLSGSNTCADGYAVDLGMKFNVADLFSFGVSVNNISGMMFWNTESEDQEPVPYTIRTGIAMEYGLNDDSYTTRDINGEVIEVIEPATRYILFSADLMMTQFERSPKLVIGAEAVLHELIAFRAGIGVYGEKFGQPQLFPMNTWGGGVSIRPEIQDIPFNTHIDYSITSDYISTTGISHHLSLMFEF